jgi:hypothetical protein
MCYYRGVSIGDPHVLPHQAQTMRSGLSDRVQIFEEFYDPRFPETEQANWIGTYLHQKYAGQRVDLVLAIGSAAPKFLAQRRDFLFPHSALMFVASKELGALGFLGPDVSRLITRFDLSPTVELALRLQPDAKRMVIVTAGYKDDQRLANITRRNLGNLAKRLDIMAWSGLLPAELLRAARDLPYGPMERL